MATPNLGLTIPIGGTTPGANNNTTPGSYPFIESANLNLIDSLCYSANNPPPPYAGSGTAPPSSGTYTRGQVYWNTQPSPGGYAGWICTAAGTPGTWKAFGPISA